MQIRVGVMCCGVNTSNAVEMSLRWGGGGNFVVVITLTFQKAIFYLSISVISYIH